ncbi:Cof-type HAD-IIB family hydrolase [Deinococcus taeanensis]|uniref:Cof-type HAD-IIB family hydrolase n=1 Tax=Deinococcus taeanensis TaxID=2737050 RepID=UPI001CDC6240|nr:Cof-type HAD-IIB family hydrolase [Deinococcus taeanensis]UBV42681.1 Cof-type HAD-IIB family hydrolase [Deinococcus taeanensis]
MSVRLIATDLDGTLLRSDLRVSARTRAALDAARAAGVHVVPVTARQPRGLRLIADAAGFTGWALCGNGAHGVHLSTGETLFEAHVTVGAQRALARALAARVPGLLFVSVRRGGEVFAAQAGYADIAQFEDHKRWPHEMDALPLEDVLAEPSLKFIVRHPALSPAGLLPEVQALKLPGFAVTHSGAPFLEVLAEGVSKAWGLERLCTHLGVARTEVLAFGDAPNDVEMLAWAGRGVAMGNAGAEARAAAGEVTFTNDEDGVAAVIEALLAESLPG